MESSITKYHEKPPAVSTNQLVPLLQEYSAKVLDGGGDISENGSCLTCGCGSLVASTWDVEMRIVQDGENDVFTVDCHLPVDCYRIEHINFKVSELGERMGIPTNKRPRYLLPRVAKYNMKFETRAHPEGFNYIVLATKVVLPKGRLDYGTVYWLSGDSFSKFEVALAYLEALTMSIDDIREADAAHVEKKVTHEAPKSVQ